VHNHFFGEPPRIGYNEIMNYEKPNIEVPIAENPVDKERIFKEDVFYGLYKNVKTYVEAEKYDVAQSEIKRELSLLARALPGDKDENLQRLKREFEAMLPTEALSLINPESPEARARAASEKRERDARIEALLKEKFNKEM
jgi:hypothetical protein